MICFLLSERQMARFPLSHGCRGSMTDASSAGRLCDPKWFAVEGCAGALWSAQDALQPLHLLKPAPRVCVFRQFPDPFSLSPGQSSSHRLIG